MENYGLENQKMFEIELDGICYGIKTYPGEIYDELLFVVIDTLADSFLVAIQSGYAFNLLTVAEKLCEATKFRISAEGTVGRLLDTLPHPRVLNEEQQFTLAQIIDGVDRIIPGTLERMQWEWQQAA